MLCVLAADGTLKKKWDVRAKDRKNEGSNGELTKRVVLVGGIAALGRGVAVVGGGCGAGAA